MAITAVDTNPITAGSDDAGKNALAATPTITNRTIQGIALLPIYLLETSFAEAVASSFFSSIFAFVLANSISVD